MKALKVIRVGFALLAVMAATACVLPADETASDDEYTAEVETFLETDTSDADDSDTVATHAGQSDETDDGEDREGCGDANLKVEVDFDPDPQPWRPPLPVGDDGGGEASDND